ncbi:MAG: hypothetical protein V4549_13540, partial [Bacteroidota bacterium]
MKQSSISQSQPFGNWWKGASHLKQSPSECISLPMHPVVLRESSRMPGWVLGLFLLFISQIGFAQLRGLN